MSNSIAKNLILPSSPNYFMNLMNSKLKYEPAIAYLNKIDNQNQMIILLPSENNKCTNHISNISIYKALNKLNEDSEKGELSFIKYSHSDALEETHEQSLGKEFSERLNYLIIGENY